MLFYSTLISLTKPRLLIAPLSMPWIHYLTVFLKELSLKYISTAICFPQLDMYVETFVLLLRKIK